MENKDYMKRVYRHFSDFISECAAKELEYFILDAKFTTNFNSEVRQIVNDLKNEGKSSIELAILFNTEGEVAVIDSFILGSHIGNNYKMRIQAYYREISLNKIVKSVINGNNKSKKDFLILSFNVIYSILKSIYSDLRYKGEMTNKYVEEYNLGKNKDDKTPIYICSILILEDICKYIGINDYILKESICDIVGQRNSQ